MHFQELLPMKTAKNLLQVKFMTKHHMFSGKVYSSPEHFTQPLCDGCDVLHVCWFPDLWCEL